MLTDARRIEAYRQAVMKTVFEKIVVDVGAGTGILSVMAAEAGANRVYAIEKSEIVRECIKLVKSKKLSQVIKVMNILAEDAPLAHDSADVIISEWMGYFLIYERMMPSVLNVRNRCLKPGGAMIPGKGKLFLAASSHKQEGETMQLSVPDLDVYTEPLVIDVAPDSIISDSQCILDINLLEVDEGFDSFTAQFNLMAMKEAVFRGFVAWFDVEMTPGEWFSTSPFHGATHWHQTFFQATERFGVSNGTRVSGTLKCFPHKNNYRGLQIDITLTEPLEVESKRLQFSWD